MLRALIAGLVLAASPAVAHADAATEEVSAGASASSTWLADKVAGAWDVDEHWQLRADFSATRAYLAGAAAMRPGDSLLAGFSAEYAPDAHWSVRATLGWSPETTTFASAHVDADGMSDATASLRATSSMSSGSLSLGYDTAGESDHETSGAVSLGGSSYDSRQELMAVRADSGEMLGVPDVRRYCAMHACGDSLQAALAPQWTQLGQVVVDASVSETLYQDTDVSLGAAYYLYDRDPTQGGYVAQASFGVSGNLGNAIGIAPMQYSLSPSLGNRWGALSVMANFSYGHFVGDQGYLLSASARVQYKLQLSEHRKLKLYAKLGGAWNISAQDELSRSGSLGVGAQLSW